MSCSPTDTERQIAAAEGAENICAGRVDTDVFALQARRAIGGFEPLATTRTTMRSSASHVDSGLYPGLWESNHRAGIKSCINACRREYQRTSLAAWRCYRAEATPPARDNICVPPPPITAELDGEAATIVMVHSRLLLLGVISGADLGCKCGSQGSKLFEIVGEIFRSFLAKDCGERIVLAQRFVSLGPNSAAHVGDRNVFGIQVFHFFFVAGDESFGHFLLLTPDPARRQLRDCAYSMSCIIHTKQDVQELILNKSGSAERRSRDIRLR